MASLPDILTSAQNLVNAVNNVATTYLNVQGAKNAAALTTATLVKSSPGRVAVVSILTAGSAVGAIYDANALGVTTGKIYTIPMTVGVVIVNLPTSYGIVVAPGSGQVVTISYS